MSTVALSRPGTIATLIASGGAVSGDAEATGAAFKIHVQEYSDQYEVKVSDVTGDGHTDVHYQHGGLLYGQFRLSGYMIAGADVGIEKLIADKNGGYGVGNAAVATHTLQVAFEANRKIQGGVIITQLQRQMAKNSPHVRLAIAGFWTGPRGNNFTNPFETEAPPP
jgi:hypothetical protein